MSHEDLARQLHDKASRGLKLSTEEQAQLEAWYADQDEKESALLGPTTSSQRLTALHAQIETTLAQLQTVTQRIQELTNQNEAVRREVTVLQHQLADTQARQPA